MSMSQTSVKQPLEESLSALMDGEITELELRRLLKADDETFTALRENWSRYHLLSAGAKNDFPAIEYRDLSQNISKAIADEPVYTGNISKDKVSIKPNKNIWFGLGRFAVAASVAGAVVLGVQFAPNSVDNQVAEGEQIIILPSASSASVPSSFDHGLPSNTAISTVSNANKTSPNNTEIAPIAITESTKQQLEQAEEQVNRLMLEHAQNAAQNTQQGVLPYARVPEAPKNQ